MKPRLSFPKGTVRANRIGLMLLILTLSQHLIPFVFYGILHLCGIDTAARSWGLPSSLYLLLYLIMYILMMGIPLWVCAMYLYTPQKPRRRSLSFPRRSCLAMLCVALCLIANILTAWLSTALYNAGVKEPSLPTLGDGTVLTLLFDIVVFAAVPAVMEEYLLRGMVLETLRPLGNGIAVSVSAILFGLLHGNIVQTPYAVLMGLILGTLYSYAADLRLCITVHAAANTFAIITGYFAQYTAATTATLWQSVIVIAVLLCGGIACLWLRRHPARRDLTPCPIPFTVRLTAVAKAPLLWLCVAVMSILLCIHL